jgi:hypothetical protein
MNPAQKNQSDPKKIRFGKGLIPAAVDAYSENGDYFDRKQTNKKAVTANQVKVFNLKDNVKIGEIKANQCIDVIKTIKVNKEEIVKVKDKPDQKKMIVKDEVFQPFYYNLIKGDILIRFAWNTDADSAIRFCKVKRYKNNNKNDPNFGLAKKSDSKDKSKELWEKIKNGEVIFFSDCGFSYEFNEGDLLGKTSYYAQEWNEKGKKGFKPYDLLHLEIFSDQNIIPEEYMRMAGAADQPKTGTTSKFPEKFILTPQASEQEVIDREKMAKFTYEKIFPEITNDNKAKDTYGQKLKDFESFNPHYIIPKHVFEVFDSIIRKTSSPAKQSTLINAEADNEVSAEVEDHTRQEIPAPENIQHKISTSYFEKLKAFLNLIFPLLDPNILRRLISQHETEWRLDFINKIADIGVKTNLEDRRQYAWWPGVKDKNNQLLATSFVLFSKNKATYYHPVTFVRWLNTLVTMSAEEQVKELSRKTENKDNLLLLFIRENNSEIIIYKNGNKILSKNNKNYSASNNVVPADTRRTNHYLVPLFEKNLNPIDDLYYWPARFPTGKCILSRNTPQQNTNKFGPYSIKSDANQNVYVSTIASKIDNTEAPKEHLKEDQVFGAHYNWKGAGLRLDIPGTYWIHGGYDTGKNNKPNYQPTDANYTDNTQGCIRMKNSEIMELRVIIEPYFEPNKKAILFVVEKENDKLPE